MNMKKTFVVVSLLLGMAALAAAQGGISISDLFEVV